MKLGVVIINCVPLSSASSSGRLALSLTEPLYGRSPLEPWADRIRNPKVSKLYLKHAVRFSQKYVGGF
ncbi:MAG: hypothetical protein U0787_14225 [Polyangia bacterium]